VKTIKLHSLLMGLALTVGAHAQAIYSQTPNLNAGADGGSYIYNSQIIADSFVPTMTAEADSLTMWGSYLFFGAPYASGTNRTFRVRMFADNGSLPGATLFDQTVQGTLTQTSTNVTDFANDRLYSVAISLANTPVLNAGTTYWLSVIEPTPQATFRWHTSNAGPGSNGAASSNGTSWVSTNTRRDTAFVLSGQPVPEPASMLILGLGAAALVRRRKAS